MLYQNNVVLGAGTVYFAPEDADGNLLGERFLGDTLELTVGIESEKKEVEGADTAIAEVIFSQATVVRRSVAFTCRDISLDNMAMFLLGEVEWITQASGTGTQEDITVSPGNEYQLGASVAQPFGVRDMSAVVVTGTGGTPTYVLDTDYSIDASLGRVKILVDGGIAADTPVEITYDNEALTIGSVGSEAAGAQNGALRFIADNTGGENRDLYVPKVELAPNGEAAFKSRDTETSLAFQGTLTTREGYKQIYYTDRGAA